MSYAESHAECLGGSEVLTALGYDHRKSPVQLWAEKRGLVDPKDDSDAATERGNEEEEGCIQYAERRLERGLLRQGVGYNVPIVKGRLGVSPDALPFWFGLTAAVPPFGVEAKTRQHSIGWGEDGSGDVPLDVATQCHAYMAVIGSPRWYVSVLFGMPLSRRLYVVERDEARCERILNFANNWWHNHVVCGEPPEAVTPEDFSRRARLLSPKSNGEVLRSDAKEVIGAMIALRDIELEYDEAKDNLEHLDAIRRTRRGVIEELIGSAAGIETPVGSAFLHSRTSRGRLIIKWPGA